MDLVLSASRMAREAREACHAAPSVIYNSDRGRQYASAAYRDAPSATKMLASMSGKSD
jgi:hypothetical protein